jgi:hypothetical protein
MCKGFWNALLQSVGHLYLIMLSPQPLCLWWAAGAVNDVNTFNFLSIFIYEFPSEPWRMRGHSAGYARAIRYSVLCQGLPWSDLQ